MIDIQLQDLHKSYGGKEVLRGVTFQMQSGEHAGLLGRNGAGKTTLFRLLCGEERPDSGSIHLAEGKSVGVLSQIPVVPPHFTALDVLLEAFTPLKKLLQDMEEMATRLDSEPRLLTSYGALQQRYEFLGGYEQDLRLARVRQGLQLDDGLCNRPFDTLSGGEKTRMNLGRLMLCNTDILLLDEPTNHLDMSAVEWLEGYLEGYPGTVLLISHDRFFLDHAVTKVFELEDGICHIWNGNYSAYSFQKEQRREEEQRLFEKNDRERRRLEDVARRMHEYAGKNAKLHRRAFAIEKRASRIPAAERPRRQAALKQRFQTRPFAADDLLTAMDLCKSYGKKRILHNVTLTLQPGERVALLGDNGAGKTTLLRILLGSDAPDRGEVRLAERCKTAILPQVVEFSHPERTLLDTMLYETGCSTQRARDRLGAFHFVGDEVFQTVETLSGGERSRLYLCILMNEDVGFLLLDEPTNHLDIQSREWLEAALEDFEGALLFVSHDRYFISRFAGRVWMLKDGGIEDFFGSYDEYRQWQSLSGDRTPDETPSASKAAIAPKKTTSKDAKADERRLRVLERALDDLERKNQSLDKDMEEFASDANRLMELMEEKAQLAVKWTETYEEWEDIQGKHC